MRKWTPFLIGVIFLLLKVLIDDGFQNKDYAFILLPGEVIYAVFGFDIWAVTEELTGKSVIKSKDKPVRALVFIFLILHLLAYLIFQAVLRDNRSLVQNNFSVTMVIAGAVHLFGPVLIALNLI